jgi:hypothetical protein
MFGLVPFVERLALAGVSDGGANDEIGFGHGFLPADRVGIFFFKT